MTQYTDSAIFIFAKAPIAGTVKTRLIPAIGADRACQLHHRLITMTVTNAVNSQLADVQLWVGSNPEHAAFIKLQQDHQIEIKTQQGANLGERMCHAMETGLKTYRQVIIVGTDCPFIEKSHYDDSFTQLINKQRDSVIIPALDGGYVLIGLSRVDKTLFENINWGEEDVFSDTKKALETLNYDAYYPSPLADIDRPEDLSLLEQFNITP